MSRLAATVATDVRVQFRNGFYFATLLVVVFSILLLRWLPGDFARLVLPVVIVENVLLNAFYFVGGLLLLERGEGTFFSQSVTPLRVDEYLASKLLTLTALSLAESLLIGAAMVGFDAQLLFMAFGIGIASALFCLAGVALVVRYHSINEFLMPSVLFAGLLTLPILGVFDIGEPSWYLPHPIHGPLILMRIDSSITTPALVYAVGYSLLWAIPLYAWSRRALQRLRSA